MDVHTLKLVSRAWRAYNSYVRAGCFVAMVCLGGIVGPPAAGFEPPPPRLAGHLAAIAGLAESSPMIAVPEGWFRMGTNRKDDDPYGLATQFDDTELPQRQIWLDEFLIDRDEASLGEFLAFLRRAGQQPSEELRALIWHMISVHAMPDGQLARWPALYVTWDEAAGFCRARHARLPTEAEWEKAARGTAGNLFPWGSRRPSPGLAVFGQHHVHEIPLVTGVNGGDDGRSPYGLHHMAGNVAEWVQDWFGTDYYAVMPERNPAGPPAGRYRSVRGGSWKSHPPMLRTATRNGAPPDQRSATIGFRCAQSRS